MARTGSFLPAVGAGGAMSSAGRPGPPLVTSFPQPLDLTFTAPIEKDGAFATFVTVPGSAEALATRRAVKVGGTIDGHEFAATLMPSGEGPHWLPLRAALCRATGKSRAGEEVTIALRQRFS
jgi:hypothetical protein